MHAEQLGALASRRTARRVGAARPTCPPAPLARPSRGRPAAQRVVDSLAGPPPHAEEARCTALHAELAYKLPLYGLEPPGERGARVKSRPVRPAGGGAGAADYRLAARCSSSQLTRTEDPLADSPATRNTHRTIRRRMYVSPRPASSSMRGTIHPSCVPPSGTARHVLSLASRSMRCANAAATGARAGLRGLQQGLLPLRKRTLIQYVERAPIKSANTARPWRRASRGRGDKYARGRPACRAILAPPAGRSRGRPRMSVPAAG
jgi:hypothetical protein